MLNLIEEILLETVEKAMENHLRKKKKKRKSQWKTENLKYQVMKRLKLENLQDNLTLPPSQKRLPSQPQ